MNQQESRIRDYLCEHLDLVEPALQLVRKEFKLRNDFGAGGSIDILARDTFGHLVVIEIKRSDQAARAALHELTKYTALLKSSQGIPADRIRAILVSTDWHELAVPFSEYLKSAEVATEGLVIHAADDGRVMRVARFEPVVLAGPLFMEREQTIYFFHHSAERDAAVAHLEAAAGKAHITDFAIFGVDYGGKNADVIYPYAAYFVFSSPIALENRDELMEFVSKTGMEWEDLEAPAENFLCWLGELATFEHGDMEIGYPEKLASMTSDGWDPRVVLRAGRYLVNSEVQSDAALIGEAMRVEGGAAHYLYRSVSPKYKPSWAAFKKDLALVLLGCSVWELFLQKFVDTVEADRPNSTISAHVYNPADLVVALAKAFGAGDYRYFSSFQVIESSPERVCIYVGYLAWTGQAIKTTGKAYIKQVFGDLEQYLLARQFGAVDEHYDGACEAANLQSLVFELANPGSPTATVRLVGGPAAPSNLLHGQLPPSVEDFVAGNPVFGASLVKHLKTLVHGLV